LGEVLQESFISVRLHKNHMVILA